MARDRGRARGSSAREVGAFEDLKALLLVRKPIRPYSAIWTKPGGPHVAAGHLFRADVTGPRTFAPVLTFVHTSPFCAASAMLSEDSTERHPP